MFDNHVGDSIGIATWKLSCVECGIKPIKKLIVLLNWSFWIGGEGRGKKNKVKYKSLSYVFELIEQNKLMVYVV